MPEEILQAVEASLAQMAVATLSGGMLNVSLQMVDLVVDRGKRVTADLTSVIKPVVRYEFLIAEVFHLVLA